MGESTAACQVREHRLAVKKEWANPLTDNDIEHRQCRCDTPDRQIDELVYNCAA